MAWSSFSLLVALCYAAYYGLNILYDLLRPQKTVKGEGTETLTFFEDQRPIVIDDPGESPEPETFHAPTKENVERVENDLRKEDNLRTADYDDEDEIVPISVETVVQNPLSGGVTYPELIRLCREKAIVESTKIEFD